MRYQGKISKWNDDQNWGVIIPNGGGHQVFVHFKSFSDRQRKPLGGEIVTYELKIDAKGRGRAERVKFVRESVPSARLSGRGNASLILAAAFLIFIAGFALAGRLPVSVLGLYVVASVIAYVAYPRDKSAARNNQWRTKETMLHLFALIGGWPGALAAQRLLRHKFKNQSFQFVFWVTVAVNCGIFGWLFLSSGAEALGAVLGVVSQTGQ